MLSIADLINVLVSHDDNKAHECLKDLEEIISLFLLEKVILKK